MTMKPFLFAGFSALALLGADLPAGADTVVAPNANATTFGDNPQTLIFGNNSTLSNQYQTGYAASQFIGVPIGAAITGVGFRLSQLSSTVDYDLDYTNFTISLGTIATSLGGLSTNFAANLGADTVLTRSGALHIAANSLVTGQPVNPFYTLDFTTPYIYKGGDLLLSTSYTSNTYQYAAVDAVSVGGVTGTVGGSTPDFIRVNFGNAPIAQFTYSIGAAVPEPASWMMMIVGFALAGAALRRRRPALAAHAA